MATYNISTLVELQAMESHLADDCVLLNNIDASATRTWNWNDTAGTYLGFQPVGFAAFTGSFDGQGFAISNLYIYRNSNNHVGLFGYISAPGKEIKDLNLVNVDILGLDGVGAIAGHIASGTVTNCHVSGTVESIGNVGGGAVYGGLGGFTGQVRSTATVTDCTSSCTLVQTKTLTDNQAIGGFVGVASAGTITDCTASGYIATSLNTDGGQSLFVGGFVGRISGAVDIDGCYATGNIDISATGSTGANDIRIGGFVGNISAGDIDKCFAYGDVSYLAAAAWPVYIGGFVGNYEAGAGTIDKCGAEGNIENYSTHATINFSGGFAGSIADTTDDCYAIGTVCVAGGVGHADAVIGGFVGDTTADTLDNCYSAGEVYAGRTNGGGFQGKDTAGSQTNCFFDNKTSGYTTTAGDATGKTTTLMKTASTFSDAGWDLTNVWEIDSYTRSPGSGTTIWLSEVADYEDFEEGVNDADSFSVTLPTTNNIMWVEALESLIAGTGGDEWKIGSNDFGVPITSTNHTIRQQTNYGSKAMQALKVNESILFVDFVGRKIRELTYSEEHGKHVAPDLSSLAEHITSSGITSIAHQRNPDSIIWCTLTDGSLISMTYERDQNVVAWANHPIDGLVQSVCVIPGSAEDEVWITVKRTMTGVNSGVFVIYVERMASRTFTDIDDCFFVDSGRTIEHSSAATTTIAGLGHLEGETVALLGDGVDLDTYTVGSGVITASTAVTTAQVGQVYTSKLEPMKPVIEAQMGTSAGSIVKVNEMGISLLDSAGVKYGTSDSALYDIDLDDARWVNLSEIDGLFTGTVTVATDGGFSLEAPLIISSSSPLPLTVRALIPKMDVTGR